MGSFRIGRTSLHVVMTIASVTALGSVSPLANAEGLTIDQAINVAIERNKDLQSAGYAVEQARARMVQAGLAPNPHLELGTKNDRMFGNEGEYTASVGVSQQFSVVGRLARQKDVARVDVALAMAEIRKAQLKLAADVASGWYRVLILSRQLDAGERLIDIDHKLVQGTRSRFKAAEVSELDVNAAQLDLQRLYQERALLQSQRTTQLAQLNLLLGRPATRPLDLDTAQPATDILPGLPELQREALALRPDLRFALLNADRARVDQALASAQRWEDWSVSIGLEQGRQVISGLPPQGTSRTIGVTLSIPLQFVNKNQGRIAEAAAAGDQASARIDALRLSIDSEIASAHAEAGRLQEVLAEYRRSMLPLSERNVSLAQRGYNQGLVSMVEVVQAQRQQGELTNTYLKTLDQYFQTLAKLRAASGEYLKGIKEFEQ